MTVAEAIHVHDRKLKTFGGLPGIKDPSGLERAVANPRNLHHYDGIDDRVLLAVRTGIAIAQNHASSDGNERTVVAAIVSFPASTDVTRPQRTTLSSAAASKPVSLET